MATFGIFWQLLATVCNFCQHLGTFGNYGNIWQLLALFCNFWQLLATMAPFCNFWHLLVTFGNFWRLLATFGNLWQFTAHNPYILLQNPILYDIREPRYKQNNIGSMCKWVFCVRYTETCALYTDFCVLYTENFWLYCTKPWIFIWNPEPKFFYVPRAQMPKLLFLKFHILLDIIIWK